MTNELSHITDEQLTDWLTGHPDAKINQDFVLIDIREQDEYDEHHIAESQHMPLSTLPCQPSANRALTAFVYCHAGGRTQRACQWIQAWGFQEIYALADGLKQWERCTTT